MKLKVIAGMHEMITKNILDFISLMTKFQPNELKKDFQVVNSDDNSHIHGTATNEYHNLKWLIVDGENASFIMEHFMLSNVPPPDHIAKAAINQNFPEKETLTKRGFELRILTYSESTETVTFLYRSPINYLPGDPYVWFAFDKKLAALDFKRTLN